jgi:sortase A
MGISSSVGLDRSDTGLTKQGVRRCAARSRVNTALRLLQGVLLSTGATLLIVYAAARIDGARGGEQALDAFAQARLEHIAAALPAEPSPSPSAAQLELSTDPDQTLWGKTRIAAYLEAKGVDHDAPLGVLTIPSIALEAAIFDGTSELTLNRGIGRIEGTADTGAAGNLGLAAHRDGFFRGLKDVRIGDTIDVESLDGTTRYRVTELSIVEPTDVHVLAPTDTATLTLVTCYPFYFIGEAPQRYIVKGLAESPGTSDAR